MQWWAGAPLRRRRTFKTRCATARILKKSRDAAGIAASVRVRAQVPEFGGTSTFANDTIQAFFSIENVVIHHLKIQRDLLQQSGCFNKLINDISLESQAGKSQVNSSS